MKNIGNLNELSSADLNIDLPTAKNAKPRKKYVWLSVAAIMLLLIGIVFYIARTQTPLPPITIKDVVYNNNLKKYCIGDVYEPSLKPGAAAPAVVVVHGGAWVTGSKNDIETKAVVEKLVTEGLVVFNINYRLQDEGGAFPHNVEDVNHAVDYLFKHAADYQIDPQRLGILGVSAGAHLALLTAYNHNPHLKTIVAIAPATDLSRLQNPFISKYFPLSDPARLSQASPLTHAASGIPTLLVHGIADQAIPFEQSKLLANALKKNNIPVELISVKDANHNFILKAGQNQETALLEIVRYLKTQLNLNPW